MNQKVSNVLIASFLSSLIAGCANPLPLPVEVRYQQEFIPDALLSGCSGPEWSGGTYRDVATLAEQRRTVIRDCDAKFREAKAYQDDLRRKSKEIGQ